MTTDFCPTCGKAEHEDTRKPPCFECPTIPVEHCGSRMPDLIREAASDPLFADAAFRPFTPEEAAMAREKAAGGRR